MMLTLRGHTPQVDPSAFVAENSTLIGSVIVGPKSSIWFGAVLRGDSNTIEVGTRSNIQDLCVLHVDVDHRLQIGNDVTVGHRAIVHGATIGNRVLVGMGAILMNGVVVGDESIIAAGSLLTEGTVVPPRSLVMGLPAKVRRELTDDEVIGIVTNAEHYVRQHEAYR